MAAEKLPIKEEMESVPDMCLKCGNYKPMFFTVAGKQCAVFGKIEGIDRERCSMWCRRIEPPKFG